MTDVCDIHRRAPTDLAAARAIAHQAAQLLTTSARANLPAAPDDSHSNIGWDAVMKGFVSHPIPGTNGNSTVSLTLAPLELKFTPAGQSVSRLPLQDISKKQATDWLDAQLSKAGAKPSASIPLPYELPPDAASIDSFTDTGNEDGLSTLSAWYDLAHRVLSEFAEGQRALQPGPSDVRCWPHHFDIATYVSLEPGDPETAKGIGVGMSPGDEAYNQPYFYINPWPHLSKQSLPHLPAPGHWHTQGFVGAIATAEQILNLPDVPTGLSEFIETAFAIGKGQLDA